MRELRSTGSLLHMVLCHQQTRYGKGSYSFESYPNKETVYGYYEFRDSLRMQAPDCLRLMIVLCNFVEMMAQGVI